MGTNDFKQKIEITETGDFWLISNRRLKQFSVSLMLKEILFILRSTRNLKRKEFSKFLGINSAKLSKLERGEIKSLKEPELSKIKPHIREEEYLLLKTVSKEKKLDLFIKI